MILLIYWIIAAGIMLFIISKSTDEINLSDIFGAIILGGLIAPLFIVVIGLMLVENVVVWRRKKT